jgi:DNA polymerase III epsilon subunit-like protein
VKLAIVDTETGGFSPERHELLEAHVLLVDEAGFVVLHEAGGRILPWGDRDITSGAAKVNGYSPALWRRTAQPLEAVLPQVLMLCCCADAWVGSKPTFDVRFLQAGAARLGLTFEPREVFDTRQLGKEPSDKGGVGLDKLCERYGIAARQGVHGARDDCYRTLAVLAHIWRFR